MWVPSKYRETMVQNDIEKVIPEVGICYEWIANKGELRRLRGNEDRENERIVFMVCASKVRK